MFAILSTAHGSSLNSQELENLDFPSQTSSYYNFIADGFDKRSNLNKFKSESTNDKQIKKIYIS